jgi:hypothetical protein
MPGARSWVIVLVLLGPLIAGCGSESATAPREAATSFARALSAQDGAAACRLLAPETKSQLEQAAGKQCPAAILEEDLPEADAVKDSSTFGTMAQVIFAGDVMFMAEFPSGWKVMAAGCSPAPGQQPGKPYDCQLQGG